RPLALDRPHRVEARRPDAVAVRRRLDETADGLRVAEDPADLLGAGALVDGDGDAAGGPDRVVDERPLVAGATHQADPVALLDALGDQSPSERLDVVAEGGAGD